MSVEEQFYVIWPLLIIAVLWFCQRHRLTFVAVLTAALIILIATSLAWSIVHTAESPGTAYFVTTTRIWQLGVGALLVLITPLLSRLSRWAGTLMAAVGVGGIVATVLTVTPETPWPGSAALMPTLGTAMVIAGGIVWAANPVARVLGVAPMRFFGGLSYGLYLWHWPVLRLIAELNPDPSLALRFLGALVAVALSWLTLHLVENPIRFNRRLSARPGPALRMAAAAVTASAVASAALWITAPSLAFDTPVADGGAIALVAASSRQDADLRMHEDLTVATQHTDAPLPDPAIASADISLAYREGCQVNVQSTEFKDDDSCWFGDPEGQITVALVGDSKMEQWSSALHAIGVVEGWRIKVYTKSGCGFVDEGRADTCFEYNRALSARLGESAYRPDLSFTSLSANYAPELAESMLRMLQPAIDGGAEVVFLANTPALPPRGMPENVTSVDCLDQNRQDYSICWSDEEEPGGTPMLRAAAERLDSPCWRCSRGSVPHPSPSGVAPRSSAMSW